MSDLHLAVSPGLQEHGKTHRIRAKMFPAKLKIKKARPTTVFYPRMRSEGFLFYFLGSGGGLVARRFCFFSNRVVLPFFGESEKKMMLCDV